MQSAGVINVIDHVKSTGLNRERIIIHSVKADASSFGISLSQPFNVFFIVIHFTFLLSNLFSHLLIQPLPHWDYHLS